MDMKEKSIMGTPEASNARMCLPSILITRYFGEVASLFVGLESVRLSVMDFASVILAESTRRQPSRKKCKASTTGLLISPSTLTTKRRRYT